jgi:hypothetical protein
VPDPKATFREFHAPANDDLGNSHLSYAPMLIRLGSHRGTGEIFGPASASPGYLSHGPIPITDTRGLRRICWVQQEPNARGEGCSSTAVSRARGALLHCTAAVSVVSIPPWVGGSGALGTKAGHPCLTAAVLRACRVASHNGLTLGCAAQVRQKVRGQREDNG